MSVISKLEPPDSKPGFTIEHILLSVTVVSTSESAGQFDDTCSGIIRRELAKYHGVTEALSEVQYKHTKIEVHQDGCQCGICDSARKATPF